MMQWVFNTPETAPAFVLARAGYDVWLGNHRGSKYSRTHKTMNQTQLEFWDFYQEDVGMKDLPTFIMFIKDKTGLEKIGYVGHSEGTTVLLMAGSLNPDFFRLHINLAVLLGPVATTANVSKPIFLFAAKHLDEIESYMLKNKMYNMFAPEPLISEGIIIFCHLFSELCLEIRSMFHHDGITNPERFPMYMSNSPTGNSYRTWIYYGQLMNTNRTQLYDYGKEGNQEKYGTDMPPLLPLDQYAVPTALLSGSLDELADPVDVANLVVSMGDNLVFQK